ncbi:RES family NAD+ phosphorylase [Mucilaginibacter sp. UR6-1]|uniref:RES family NAD+ phosphorylase n=1 Tax=Mucilaginibacter sp. UR6-1 TaxID=1435643 RepID=UPI001E3F59A8|nr:RES family NAD+ phosphorylase [Mucilaginibacter sp. UR6-1]MCC8409871.1 RES family NAD+ phosphorylase [Mucilaginibacter sp. UR6-1]
MIVYRITSYDYGRDLTGTGARLYGGRWNSEGRPMLYTASSRSLAVLEVLVHLPPLLVPDNYCLVEIELPANSILQIDVQSLPENWHDISVSRITRQIGDEFLKKGEHLILSVPSIIVPAEFNYLINPRHPDMEKARIVNVSPFRFDDRLL